MSKAELVEKLTIATICNEATDSILKQIAEEDNHIESLKVRIARVEKSIEDMESPSEKLEDRSDRYEQSLGQHQEKREKLTLLLKPKIDTAAIEREIEEQITSG